MASVLVVDDSKIMRRRLREALEGIGHHVVGEADNGKEAVTKFDELRPDLVTMDISMPGVDGIDSTKQIISAFPLARIIVVSAISQKDKVYAALKSGARHFIIKPIDNEDLAEVINEVFANDEIESKLLNETETANKQIEISNNNGQFVIKVPDKITYNKIMELENNVNGLLIIKPLKVKLDLSEVSFIADDCVSQLAKMGKKIKSIRGEWTVIAREAALKKKLEVF